MQTERQRLLELINICIFEDYRLHQHTSVEATQLLDNERTVRRLKRLKPFELV
jgi:hypothetical protein